MTHEEMMSRGHQQREGAATIERLDPVLLEGHRPWYLFNIYGTEHQINLGTAGQYYVPPCPEGEIYVRSPTVIPGVVADTYPHFSDKEEYRVRAIPGKEVVACALGIGPGQTEGESIVRFGVFASQNDVPTKPELSKAKAALVPELQRELRKADQFFSSAKAEERESVNNEQYFRAARYMNVKKPWMHESTEMTLCPFCSIAVRPEAAKCSGCNEVINAAAYAAIKQSIGAN